MTGAAMDNNAKQQRVKDEEDIKGSCYKFIFISSICNYIVETDKNGRTLPVRQKRKNEDKTKCGMKHL